MPDACLNCGHPIENVSFCPNCGQRDIQPGIRFKDVIVDFVSISFSVEGPIWQTLKMLVLNPGELFRSFIGGRRKRFYKPIQFFIVCSLIYFAGSEFVDYNPIKDRLPSVEQEQVGHYETQIKAASSFLFKNLNNMLFLLILSTAVVLKIAHWKRHTFSEYLAVGFYIVGMYILVGLINLVVWVLELPQMPLHILFFFVYFAFAYTSLIGNKKALRFFTGLFMALAAFVLYFSSAFLVSWVAVG